ncbi:pannexin-3 [Spea bombifrons]|uniref:pannexin-3 n=1 Tax=Spea bombifrons TaxID=233779 RepID=UPI00234B6E53|nr:pannexin-3 [Spea bombifrons]
MSLAQRAAEYMLSDSLLPESNPPNKKRLRLELPLDRIIKLVSIGLPLLLVSLAFAREITNGPQVLCFPPGNLSEKHVQYVEKHCWHSLRHHEVTAAGGPSERSLWVHKVYPYILLLVSVAMYIPAALWKYVSRSSLSTDLTFIVDELDKSYNRSIRLVQHLLDSHRTSADPALFWEEIRSARHVRYFEFPLLERYLSCKQRSHRLAFAYLLRHVLLLAIILGTCAYLAAFHLTVFYQDEFNCHVKGGFLSAETPASPYVNCKFVSLSVFQIVSVANAAVYVLLLPLIVYNLSKLFRWDKPFLNVYEMLPAFDLLTNKMLGCPLNDLNVLILFLRANVSELRSFGRLSVVCALKDAAANGQNIDTVVDFMTLLVGMDIENSTLHSPAACEANPDGNRPPPPKAQSYEMAKMQEKK